MLDAVVAAGTALPISSLAITALVIAAFLTAALTAAIGIGGGSLLLGLAASLLPGAAVAPIHTALQSTLHPARAWYLREHIQWQLLIPVALGSLLGVGSGIALWQAFSPSYLTLLVGGYIALVALLGPSLGASRFVASRGSKLAGFGIGLFAATIAGVVPATGPLVGTWVKPRVSTPQGFVATHAATMATQTLSRIAGLLFVFDFTPWLVLIVSMIVAGQIGTKIGVRWAGRWDAGTFDKALRLVLLLLALTLLVRGFTQLA